MEKFGIFELLDALSALSAPTEGGQTRDGGEIPAATAEPTPPDGRERDRAALAAFMERHEALSKKIDGKK